MNQKTPRISVVMCTYNGAKFLDAQLQSILQQSCPPFEVIIADDGSSDGTWARLQEYAQRFPQIVVYQNPQNLGYIKNFEGVLQKASGEFIAIADQDDIWELDKLALQYKNIENCALIYHNSELIDANGNSLGKFIADRLRMYEGKDCKALFFSNCVSGHTIFFRRNMLQYALPFSTKMHYDWWIAIVALMYGGIRYLPNALVKYRQHEQNITDIQLIKKDDLSKKERLQREFDEYLLRVERIADCLPADAPDKAYFAQLVKAFRERKGQRFSFRLFGLLYKYINVLFFVQKKGFLRRMKHIFFLSFFRSYAP